MAHDDLRRALEEDLLEEDEDEVGLDDPVVGPDRPFLGMTPVERMFLSIFLFMNVMILGLALLLATGRIVF